MRTAASIRILALALLLAASQVVLVTHAAAHFNSNATQCQLCVSHAQQMSALPSADWSVAPAPAQHPLETMHSAGIAPAGTAAAFQARAPPPASF